MPKRFCNIIVNCDLIKSKRAPSSGGPFASFFIFLILTSDLLISGTRKSKNHKSIQRSLCGSYM